MNIFFDYQAFEMQRFGGVSRSYAELIFHLRKIDYCFCKIGVKESDNVYLKKLNLVNKIKPLHFYNNMLYKGKKRIIGQRTLANKLIKIMGYSNYALDINKDYCIKQLNKQLFDIFEPTFFDPYFLPHLNGKPFVLTVHDMISELLNYDEQQAIVKRKLCPLATHIHVPSQNTKDDLIHIMNIPSERITVIPHGSPSTPPIRQSLFDFPYLLYVGARWSYKNFSPFIKECAHAIDSRPDLFVVCTGEPFSVEEIQLFNELKIVKHVVNVPLASDEVLQSLYQHAIAFVYPSAYEGFGIPILEAFVNRCPVMLNRASCFPEIGGDAAIYFDINQNGCLCEQIISFMDSNEEYRQEIITRGINRAKLFSWEKSAKMLMHIYNSII